MPTSIKLTDVTAIFRDALLADAAIEAYCQDKYDLSLKVYVGLDENRFPAEEDTPFIVLAPDLENTGQEVSQHSFTNSMIVAITNDNYGDINTNGATEWEGLYQIDELCALIRTSLYEASKTYNIGIDVVNYDMMDVSFPMAVGSMTVNSTVPNVLGGVIGLGG